MLAIALRCCVPALRASRALAADPRQLDRSVLPIQEPTRPTYRELDARTAKPPALFDVKAPAGAPNVVIVLIDDLGFGAPSTFGGPIATPTLDKLAQNGLRYNNFHTTALCSPPPGGPQGRTQPSHGEHGLHHRDRHCAARGYRTGS
jgi:arylsulfatase